MKRIVAFVAVALLALSSSSTTFAATKHPLKDVSVPGSLGATRASFDLTYGAPVSDTLGDLEKQLHSDEAHYTEKKSGVDIDVLFVLNKDNKKRAGDRAFDLLLTAPAGKTWSLVDAGLVGVSGLPQDAVSLGDLAPVAGVATESYDWEEQSFTSAFIAKVIPDKTRYIDDKIGTITISLQPDGPDSYSQVNFGTDVN